VAPGERLRVGGLVKEGSVVRAGDRISFAVTDTANDVKVTYSGIVPDLFREGQGVVAEGVLRPDGLLAADSVLAKHDERYMPREAVEALKRQGMWRGDGPAGTR
jgi:cytochrome c-type biogenesis protein CcmE